MSDSTQSKRQTRPARGKKRRNLFSHALILAMVTVAFTGVGLFAFEWWQDRPLREVAQLLGSEEFESSLALANQYLSQYPRDSRAQILKARALSALGHHAAADSLFQQVALQLDGFPDDAEALRAWSVSLLHLQQWSRAITIQETLLKTFPLDPEILYPLTVARIRLLRYDDALESAIKLAGISGREQQANVMVGTIHHDQGNGRAALDVWQNVLEENPDAVDLQISPGEFFAMVGEEFLDSGIPDKCAALLERSIETLPRARTFSLLGRAYLQTGRQAEAVQAWEKALLDDAREPIAIEELANVALRNGNPQRAVDLAMPLAATSDFRSSSAYILQRAFAQLKESEKSETWRVRANQIREVEKNRSTLVELIKNSHDPFWSGFLRAWQLADQQQWSNAEKIVSSLLKERPGESLLLQLAEAIRLRGELPSLSALTNQKF